MSIDLQDKQGGKLFGQIKARQEEQLNAVNQEFLDDENLQEEVEELEEKLLSYKNQFMEYDLNNNGEIDFDELKLMMEKLGQAKTHLELKKMISEVDKTGKGTICYRDFVDMMLGTKTTVLKLILLFEEKMKKMNDKTSPKGPPPKRSLADLP